LKKRLKNPSHLVNPTRS